MGPINIDDAKTQLFRLVERATAGEEIIIAKGGRPVAKLVALANDATPRTPGSMRGRIRLSDDFDAPLPPSILAGSVGDV
jgi:prevent-host-death family protein